MGGKATQFGIDEEELESAVEYVKANEEFLQFLGIHVYAGTQCMDEDAIVVNITNTIDIAKRHFQNQGLECSFINLGGGFGVPYYEQDKTIDLQRIAELAKKAIQQFRASANGEVRFVIELGRYLVASAGIYVARVISEKKSRGELFFILDGGMNHHLAASGNLGAMIIRKNYLFQNLSNPLAPEIKCNLVGPLCTPIDLMAKGVSIQSPQVSDIIGIMNSGSYGFTASPLLFLGHETPFELMLVENKIISIREPRKLTDLN